MGQRRQRVADNDKQGWQNRIIKRGRGRIGDFAKNKSNPKSHPYVQKERMQAVLDKFGQVGELYLWKSKRNNDQWTIFDGHLRESIDPNQEWDLAWTSLSDEEVDELVLFYDPIAALAIPDPSRQMDLMQDLRGVDGVLGAFLDELARDNGFRRNDPIQPNAPEDFREYGEDIEIEHQCPKCGYQWSGGS